MSVTLWIIISAVSVLTLTVLYHFWHSARNTIVFLGSAIGIASAAMAVVLSFFQLKEVANQYKLSVQQSSQGVLHSRQQVAFDYSNEFFKLQLADVANTIEELQGKTPDQIDQYLRANEAKRKKFGLIEVCSGCNFPYFCGLTWKFSGF